MVHDGGVSAVSESAGSLNRELGSGESDGSTTDARASLFARAPQRTHPAGFPVFLLPEDEHRMDEYCESDPYSIETNLSGPFHQARVDCTLSLVERVASATPRILDVGCGQGHITHAISERLPTASVHGLDCSVTAVEYALRHFEGIGFALGDADDLPYADDVFDIVVCNNLWEHVSDPLSVLAGIRRVLRAGGYLVMSTPSRYRLGNILRVVRGKPVALMSQLHVTEYSVGQVLEQLKYGGFETVDVMSRRIPTDSLLLRTARIALSTWLGSVHSHHLLDSTAFYLARKL
jgi:2-polyprenyl-3-methyl-5-hydroxy-6-metoxy-1,4-benzoquinol methylase